MKILYLDRKFMQLFYCSDIQIQSDQLKIRNNPELVRQLRKVLRALPGYRFFIQIPWENLRYHLELIKRTDVEVHTSIIEKVSPPASHQPTAMIIALPNKQEKLELIVQKLTEIWISNLYFRASERSILKELSGQKMDRLQKIMIEASEQSRSRSLPHIHTLTSREEIRNQYQILVFDLPSATAHNEDLLKASDTAKDLPLVWVIGPEGGLTARDYEHIAQYQLHHLGKQILRMETAAIIAGWLIKNNKIQPIRL